MIDNGGKMILKWNCEGNGVAVKEDDWWWCVDDDDDIVVVHCC